MQCIPYGGIATYVRDATRWLAARGHDIEVVCVNRRRTPHSSRDGSVKVDFVAPKRIRPRRVLRLASRIPGIGDLFEAYSGWALLEDSLGAWSVVDRLSRDRPFDPIECDDCEGLALWGLWPIHRHRILLRGHGILHLDLPFMNHPGARFHHKLEAPCAQRADYILTAARYLTDVYRMELEVRHGRIANLPLPLDAAGLPRRNLGPRVIALVSARIPGSGGFIA